MQPGRAAPAANGTMRDRRQSADLASHSKRWIAAPGKQELGMSIVQVSFPSEEWLNALHVKLNADGRYAVIARAWEGEIFFNVRPDAVLHEPLSMYLDLWHGTCRGVLYAVPLEKLPAPKFVLTSAYGNFAAVLKGELHPMTAMMTSKLKVDGNLAYMMRNVPTVLDFVRCAREITGEVL